jgi:V-type H+-transporting ATPase subunit D
MSRKVLPSRSALQQQKIKLTGAKKGYDLLKKKLDGLKKRHREVMLEILEQKKNMGSEFSAAMFGLMDAKWGAGDFGRLLVETIKRATMKVNLAQANVAGVYIPVFHPREEEGDDSTTFQQLGITGGGTAIAQCKEKFVKLTRVLVQLAGLQTSFITLDEVIKVTSRRVNALENVVIPFIQDNI